MAEGQKQIEQYRTQHKQFNSDSFKPLSYSNTYCCPACASGELSAIALMDVFACDFCRHLFTANLETQSVQLADSVPSRAWQWTGDRWQVANQPQASALLVWTVAGLIAVAPLTIIAISNYIFPPSGSLKFVVVWLVLTGVSHGAMAAWLLLAYHRWPWYVAGLVRLQRLRAYWQDSISDRRQPT